MMDFRGKKVTVIGLGESGFQAALLLLRNGALVTVSDSSHSPETEKRAGLIKKQGATVETGGHTEDFIAGSNLIVKSPGVRHDAQPVLWARDARIPIIGEIELGSYFCKAQIIALTGSNGKSTTATLIGEILKGA